MDKPLHPLDAWRELAALGMATIEQVADGSGLPASLVKKFFSGRKEATTKQIIALAKSIGYEVKFSVDGHEEVKPKQNTSTAYLGEAIFMCRAINHLSRESLCLSADIGQITLFNIEKGKTVQWSSIERVCECLGINPKCEYEPASATAER